VRLNNHNSDLLHYLVDQGLVPGDRLPALSELSDRLDVSVSKLREQLELARQLGIVSVRPRHGTRREKFDFHPAVQTSLFFGLATGEATFEQFSELRQTIETNMWFEAVQLLTDEDKAELQKIMGKAWDKLRGNPVHIPNGEHRALHLKIFRRLDNPFVQGLLQAYWDAYEAIELTRFADYKYWLDVWNYHQQIVDAIYSGNFENGREILVKHFQLLPTVTHPEVSGNNNQ
jgi:DNA-binding FadR family transcriptional regulator